MLVKILPRWRTHLEYNFMSFGTCLKLYELLFLHFLWPAFSQAWIPPSLFNFDPLPHRTAATMATSDSSSTVCSRPLQTPDHKARTATNQASISVLICCLSLLYCLRQQRVLVHNRGHQSAVDWNVAVRMGNIPNSVKHCLSYEQFFQDYPWLRHWLLEEKVGVAFLVSNLLHMFGHMTSLWQRL